MIDFHEFLFAADNDILVDCVAHFKLLYETGAVFIDIIDSACWYQLLSLWELKAAQQELSTILTQNEEIALACQDLDNVIRVLTEYQLFFVEGRALVKNREQS